MSKVFKISLEEIEEPTETIVQDPVVEDGVKPPTEDDPFQELDSPQIAIIRESTRSDINDSLRTLDVVRAMEEITEVISNIDEPKETDITLLRIASRMAVAGTDFPETAIVPSMEGIGDIKDSIALIGDKIFDTMKALGGVLVGVFKKIINWVKHLIFKLKSSENKIKALKGLLQKVKSTTKVESLPVTVKSSRDFRYGKAGKQVETTQEYLEQYAKTAEFSQTTADTILSYAEGSYGMAFELVTSLRSKEEKETQFRKVYRDLAFMMETFTKNKFFIKGSGITNAIRNTETYSTEPFLGLFYATCRLPVVDDYEKLTHADLRGNINSFKLEYDIRDLESMNNYSKEITFENIDTGFIETILNVAQETIVSYRTYAEHIEQVTDNRLDHIDNLASSASTIGGNAVGGAFGKNQNERNRNAALGSVLGSLVYQTTKAVVGGVTGIQTLITVSTDLITNSVWLISDLSDTMIDPAIDLAHKAILTFQSAKA